MFIYACDCIGLRNTVIMMYMYLTMLYPINDLNLKYNKSRGSRVFVFLEMGLYRSRIEFLVMFKVVQHCL
jgi:hypothetical protein